VSAQKTRTRKAKAGAAKAEKFIENKLGEALAAANAAPKPEPKKRMSVEAQLAAAGVTKEGIEKARDKDGLSWADVAKAVGLKTPGAARKAYEVLTGRSHASSVMTGKRAPRGSKSSAGMLRPQWDNDTDTDTITEAVEGRRIYVRRPLMTEPEELGVAKVLYYDTETNSADPKPMDLTLCFTEGHLVQDTKSGRMVNNGTGAARAVFVKDIVEVR